MNRKALLGLAGGLLLFAACRGSGGLPPPLYVSVEPDAATAHLGGAAVTFTANYNGTTTPPTWTLTGPGTLSTQSGDTTAYTPPATADGTVTLTVTVTNGTKTQSAVATITLAP